MRHSRFAIAAAALALALLVPIAAGAGGHGKSSGSSDAARRVLFATDAAGNLHRFRAGAPEATRTKAITGLPAGVVLEGIDFRPATGDLYGLGSDRVVYRVTPLTAIAVAEGPAFETVPTALAGDRIGFDFNPRHRGLRRSRSGQRSLRRTAVPHVLPWMSARPGSDA